MPYFFSKPLKKALRMAEPIEPPEWLTTICAGLGGSWAKALAACRERRRAADISASRRRTIFMVFPSRFMRDCMCAPAQRKGPPKAGLPDCSRSDVMASPQGVVVCGEMRRALRIDAIAALIVAEAVFVPEGLVMADASAIGRNRLGLLIHRLQARSPHGCNRPGWAVAASSPTAGHKDRGRSYLSSLRVDRAGGTDQRQGKQAVFDHFCLLNCDLPN